MSATAPTTTEPEHVTGLAKPFQAAGQGKKRAAPVTEPARTGKVWATVTVVGQQDVNHAAAQLRHVGDKVGGRLCIGVGLRLNTVF